ncbi:MAG: hypothetical protein ACHQ7H_19590, partial [Candidatus Rokuibacteriota bacterium]
MTVADFLQALDDYDKVEFDGHALSAPTTHLARGLANMIKGSLESSAQVFGGLETSALEEGPTWKGQLTWWLVLPGRLIEVTVKRGTLDKTGRPRSFKMSLNSRPLRSIGGTLQF